MILIDGLRVQCGESISKHELFTLFDAARWAPSSFNNQPWRFIYGEKGSTAFDGSLTCLFRQIKNGARMRQRSFWLFHAKHSATMASHPVLIHLIPVHRLKIWLCKVLRWGWLFMVWKVLITTKRAGVQRPWWIWYWALFALVRQQKSQYYLLSFKKESPSERKPLETIIAEGHFSFKD